MDVLLQVTIGGQIGVTEIQRSRDTTKYHDQDLPGVSKNSVILAGADGGCMLEQRERQGDRDPRPKP